MNKTDFEKIIKWIPDAIIDLRYLSSDNFFGTPIYDQPYDVLRVGTLEKLKKAADILRKKNYRIVVWDAYRPLKVQARLWDKIPDDRFVAHPSKGSNHNRGCAVDITLADQDGNLLEMPSEFDDFSSHASADLDRLEEPALTHLKDAQEAMTRSGFEINENEWWHFSDTEWKNYDFK